MVEIDLDGSVIEFGAIDMMTAWIIISRFIATTVTDCLYYNILANEIVEITAQNDVVVCLVISPALIGKDKMFRNIRINFHSCNQFNDVAFFKHLVLL